MGVKSALPFVGMVIVQFAQVGLMVVSKKGMATGMTNFTFVFYSNFLASLILLPFSFLIHRSNRPPLTFTLLCGFALLGLIGFLVQAFGYAGIQYASASLASSLMNLIPGFTFILAIIFSGSFSVKDGWARSLNFVSNFFVGRFLYWMEKVDCRSSSTLAKSIGTLVSIIGAFIVTLYKGPLLLKVPSKSIFPHHFLQQPSNWVLGGLLLAIDCVFSSVFIITQALILKKYPAELIVMFSYCLVVAILSAAVSLIVEREPNSWSLQPNMRLFAVLYSGLFGAAFQVTVGAWCLKKKGILFVAMFHPLGIVIATSLGVIFLGDAFYLGSLVGSIVIVIGFYSVMWGKAKEGEMVEVNTSSKLTSEKTSLLQNSDEENQHLLLK